MTSLQQRQNIKVKFQNRDVVLGAMVRALAIQAAGARVVGGMTGSYLQVHGFFRFALTPTEADRFKELVKAYLPTFHSSIQIEEG